MSMTERIYRLLRDVRDSYRSGADYLWFCRWIP
ncbi:hypothetical protein HEP81_04654 [Streptomyces griseofuscus]|uniref:Uncharacterized protein n=1 Tax=Streptomyces griseofuscus TaxID=146922 RepID=A0A7H1Q3P6_9ACTN|nr:hypothetical protein HEP81_04654 [Streptomyces griseofuscus]